MAIVVLHGLILYSIVNYAFSVLGFSKGQTSIEPEDLYEFRDVQILLYVICP